MFSSPRPDVVDTGTPGYAYLFDTTSGESYIFLQNMVGGNQSGVNLVANTDTGELVVQKIDEWLLPPNPLMDPGNLANKPKNREIRILAYLNSFMHNPPSPIAPLTPRWTTCISHDGRERAISYWKRCSGGLLPYYGSRTTEQDMGKFYFPISLLARCISQVSETLHVMYHSGPEAVYHCDLHPHNIFLHFDPHRDGPLPDFYIGDFGLSLTATEWLLDTKFLYVLDGHPQCRLPDTAPLGQRRRWDIGKFITRLKDGCFIDIAVTAGPQQAAGGLQALIAMLMVLDNQDRDLAARDPNSRPPSLLEVAREAKELEIAALAVEQDTEQFKASIACGRAGAERWLTAKKPFVFHAGTAGRNTAVNKAGAESYGRCSIDGNFRVIESV